MNSQVIMCCARLHNFIIDNDGLKENEEEINGQINVNDISEIDGEEMQRSRAAPDGMIATPTMREAEFVEIQGVSHTRRAMVEWLEENNYERPEYNLLRNSRIRIAEKRKNRTRYDNEYFHPS